VTFPYLCKMDFDHIQPPPPVLSALLPLFLSPSLRRRLPFIFMTLFFSFFFLPYLP
jgi:hypothetical protein